MKLESQRVLITGAGGGIGRALARELAEPGTLGDRPAMRVPRKGLLWGEAWQRLRAWSLP